MIGPFCQGGQNPWNKGLKDLKTNNFLTTAAVALMLTSGMALAKAHDQGAADGTSPDSTSETVSSIEGPGISSVTSGGARGAQASERKSDNRVDPVTGNGKNSRD